MSLLLQMPRFELSDPSASPAAMKLAVKLLYEFDKLEQKDQASDIASGKPVSRGTVLIFLPGTLI